MKNITKDINQMDLCQIALQVYDKGAVTKKQLSEIIKIDFDSGKLNKEIWGKSICVYDLAALLMQLFDKQLINQEILLKILFDMEVEEDDISDNGHS